MKRLLPWLTVAVAAFVLAACNSSNPNVLPTPGPTCSPGNIQTQLIYPAPGATGIPDAFGQVIVASSPSPLPTSWNVVVVTAISPSGVSGNTFQPATPPFPTPNATPSFSSPQYQSSAFGQNFPGEVVTVFLNNTASTCTPVGPLGSFTTQ